jgi:hypothetical protein
MRFLYDKATDKKCNEALAASEFIFDQEKKTGNFPVDSGVIKKFELLWTTKIEKEFQDNLYKIFRDNVPRDFTCYINSSPYSMDLENGISVTASTQTPIRAICHEVNHYLFRKSLYKDKYFPSFDIEDAKEIFTIVNNLYFKNIMENQDIGWKKFWKDRYTFLNTWIKEHDI